MQCMDPVFTLVAWVQVDPIHTVLLLHSRKAECPYI